MNDPIKIIVEHTDTFGGEANYSWCTRKEIEMPEGTSELAVIRRAKKEVGMSGVCCRREDWGETVALYPIGYCQVIFITPNY